MHSKRAGVATKASSHRIPLAACVLTCCASAMLVRDSGRRRLSACISISSCHLLIMWWCMCVQAAGAAKAPSYVSESAVKTEALRSVHISLEIFHYHMKIRV